MRIIRRRIIAKLPWHLCFATVANDESNVTNKREKKRNRSHCNGVEHSWLTRTWFPSYDSNYVNIFQLGLLRTPHEPTIKLRDPAWTSILSYYTLHLTLSNKLTSVSSISTRLPQASRFWLTVTINFQSFPLKVTARFTKSVSPSFPVNSNSWTSDQREAISLTDQRPL